MATTRGWPASATICCQSSAAASAAELGWMPTAASSSYSAANRTTARLDSAETAGQTHRLDPRPPRPCNHFAAVGVEILLVEMGVGVNKHDDE